MFDLVTCRSSRTNSSNNLPRLKNVYHVDVAVLMLNSDVLPYVRFHLARVVAIRTLESRLLTALISQMTSEVLLPIENASTVWVWTGKLASFHEPIGAPMARPHHEPPFVP